MACMPGLISGWTVKTPQIAIVEAEMRDCTVTLAD